MIGLAVLVLSLLVPTQGLGQADPEYPHGDMNRDCNECHTTAGWRPLRDPLGFDHGESGFPLESGHKGVECTSCHETLDFRRVATACADCHADVHRGELGFGCESCHIPVIWDNRREMWDRHSATLFPLTGAHASVDCAGCHRASAPFEYATTPVDCVACHAVDYANTTRPDHQRAGFPVECQFCHETISWQPARIEGNIDFDHSFFPLTGSHRGLSCIDCHEAGFFGTPADCYACHRQDYENTRDPNHVDAGFPTQCEACHNTNNWDDAEFDHDQFFRLTGAHRRLDCEECHTDGFQGTPTECYDCHRSDYEGTDDPDHVAEGFPRDCEGCHGTSSWEGATINHNEFFPLTGGHRGLACEACHANGFQGTPSDCYACHRSDYEGTTDPDHVAAGLPRDCENCHSTSSWEGAVINHDQFFPLTGRHRNLDCEACHSNGFAGTPTDCWSCHQADYNNADDPDHVAAGFPHECELCHTTSDWEGAEFREHDSLYFPIFSGRHRNEWSSCAQCHTNPNNFAVFSCFECHSRAETDDEHDDVPGYIYDSNACYECHPTGNAD